jgi:hypothetical protein
MSKSKNARKKKHTTTKNTNAKKMHYVKFNSNEEWEFAKTLLSEQLPYKTKEDKEMLLSIGNKVYSAMKESGKFPTELINELEQMIANKDYYFLSMTLGKSNLQYISSILSSDIDYSDIQNVDEFDETMVKEKMANDINAMLADTMTGFIMTYRYSGVTQEQAYNAYWNLYEEDILSYLKENFDNINDWLEDLKTFIKGGFKHIWNDKEVKQWLKQ